MATAPTQTPVATIGSNRELSELLQVQAPSEVIDWINMLIYGEPGVGKTWFAGTAEDHADTAPVLYLDIDGGVVTLRHRTTLHTKAVRSIDKPGGLNDIYEKLFNAIDPVTKKLPYNTIVVDRLDELADLDMRFVMREAYNRNPDKVDIDVPSPREWGIVRNHIRKLVRAFRDLPCHVIMVAGVSTYQEEGQPTKFSPAFAGKLRTELPGFFDIVGYYYGDNTTGEITRRLQLQSTRRVQAKDRTNTLGEFIDNPTIPILWDTIQNTTT